MADRIKNKLGNSGKLHPRNPHAGRYDFEALCSAAPDLKRFLKTNPKGDQTIDFSDGEAVLTLNQALLAHYYKVMHWQIPPGYLCPPIPGRADAIHYLADLLAASNGGEVPRGKGVKVLDIGTGANCIYPIIGSQSYGWKFVGTDVDSVALKTARAIVDINPCLRNLVRLVMQKKSALIFKGVIRGSDRYDLTICNPPFHASLEEAQAANRRKVKNLGQGGGQRSSGPSNFGGQGVELSCPGGEIQFLTTMIKESVEFGEQVKWFSSLVSKSEHLHSLKHLLKHVAARQVKVIEMSQGQKRSRLLAWSFEADDSSDVC